MIAGREDDALPPLIIRGLMACEGHRAARTIADHYREPALAYSPAMSSHQKS